MFEALTEREDIGVETLKYEHNDDIRVRIKKIDGEWKPRGTTYTAAWVDRERGCEEVPKGETLDDEEISRRKSEAIKACREIIEDIKTHDG